MGKNLPCFCRAERAAEAFFGGNQLGQRSLDSCTVDGKAKPVNREYKLVDAKLCGTDLIGKVYFIKKADNSCQHTGCRENQGSGDNGIFM